MYTALSHYQNIIIDSPCNTKHTGYKANVSKVKDNKM